MCTLLYAFVMYRLMQYLRAQLRMPAAGKCYRVNNRMRAQIQNIRLTLNRFRFVFVQGKVNSYPRTKAKIFMWGIT